MRTTPILAILLALTLGARVLSQSRPGSSGSLGNIDTAGPQLRVGIARQGGGYTVGAVPLETYVARVLAGEAARDSRPAALEALAITIRTFALANPGRHRSEGFDLCDQTHCQVVRAPTPATERAAQATAGQVLMHDGVPASVFYSASCGGRTEVPSGVWPGADDPLHLPSRADDACEGEPAWEASLGEADVLRALRAAGFRGDRLRELRVLSRNSSGRVARIKVDGLKPDEISGQDLRLAVGRTLGWQYIKSTAFELGRQSAVYRFSGHGSGHGVGLCVIGSTHLAVNGKSAEAILAKYFPGLTIGALGSRGVLARPEPPRVAAAPAPAGAALDASRETVVWLPDEEQGERDAIGRVASAARDELARTLGVPPPARLTVRVHPTTDDYERATGQPWFASDAVIDGELHLLPLAVLRERGVLDRTIRHQLVHALTDGVLARRPAWVREGAAIHFADENAVVREAVGPQAPQPFPTRPGALCPKDQELRRPVSIGALSSAYARARECFVRALAAGKNWRDVS
ncbi:MAG: hypothetical protein A3G76_15760 [Acidobacteria bacterium RIFCSPLOWO2_12_FULL_65_11]|nr:MAG: hypothetical protein A3H95_11780 [Acidobacteria bacterium RIFCSPLOWO2_02_FULL_64_15]OFW28912.1 MAG: hypothetical protein A3G76_15760 [Acidobacteria bacterium RIFCSPLOWO2_12_FULL_65_11]